MSIELIAEIYLAIFWSELKATINEKDNSDIMLMIMKNLGQIYLKYLLAYSSLKILLTDGAINID